jgi:hypothetical protein
MRAPDIYARAQSRNMHVPNKGTQIVQQVYRSTPHRLLLMAPAPSMCFPLALVFAGKRRRRQMPINQELLRTDGLMPSLLLLFFVVPLTVDFAHTAEPNHATHNFNAQLQRTHPYFKRATFQSASSIHLLRPTTQGQLHAPVPFQHYPREWLKCVDFTLVCTTGEPRGCFGVLPNRCPNRCPLGMMHTWWGCTCGGS